MIGRDWHRQHVFKDKGIPRQDRFVDSKVDKVFVGVFGGKHHTPVSEI
jgi:hypothetical protein